MMKRIASLVGAALTVAGMVGGAKASESGAGRARTSLCAKIAAEHRVITNDVWYGHSRTVFDFRGRKAWVVEPKAPAEGLPWTWTMQWAEAFVPRTGVPDLLKRGFHHVTIDLFDTRMDEKGLKAAADFQAYLVRSLGFAPRANLVGLSWGGFFSVRYAVTHPKNVRRIYLDCPLLTFKGFSWGPNALGPWPIAEDWTDDPRMPVNMAPSLAASGIPVLLRYGGADKTVNPALNSDLFVTRFKAAGGEVDACREDTLGHHPHGFGPEKMDVVIKFFTRPASTPSGASCQLQRIWATEPERIAAAIRDYPEAFRDGFIISAFPETIRHGPASVKDFSTQKAFAERFQRAGVPVQICISSTIGHCDEWTLPNALPKMVASNGQVAKAMACPRSDAFKAALRERFARYAALRPSVLWLDDDFRMPFHRPVDFACFCDACVAKFNSRAKLTLTREALRRTILADETVSGVNVRDAFDRFAGDALNDLVKIAADAVHAIDANVALGFMVCNPNGMAYGARDLKLWRELGRNAKGEVWFRPGSGAYTDDAPFSNDGILVKNIEIARLVAATEGEGVVNASEEVTYPYSRKTKSMRMTFLECALNIGLAGCDGTTYDAIKPNLAEQLGKGAIVDMINRRRGELDLMRRLIAGKRQIGLGVEPLAPRRGPVKSFHELLGRDERAVLERLCAGVPLTFRPENASQAWAKFDRAKLPARIDAPTRMGLSLWASADGVECIAFVWNFGFDTACDARLVLAEAATVETCDAHGGWSVVGVGRNLALPATEPWSVRLMRLRRQ